MPATLNFFDTYILMALEEEVVPPARFFKDRYFPTGAGDIFAADKVLTEYRKGNRKMAAFVAPRTGDIPLDRRGYEIHEFTPPRISPSRLLTLDDLTKRGFGEALYPGMTQAERAARIQLDDLTDMEDIIVRREEWMAAQTMINNGCDMQEYIDADTEGEVLTVRFYEGADEHAYTVANKWDSSDGDIFGDVKAMCHLLTRRNLPVTDLVLGTDAADALLDIQKVRDLLDNRRFEMGSIEPTLMNYPGVTLIGRLNFGGHLLNVIEVAEEYVDDDDKEQSYFPKTSAMVTAPGCGHMMYGAINQIDYGSTEFSTHAASRVPKFELDQKNDTRKLRVATRPLAAPRSYCPYIYAADVVG